MWMIPSSVRIYLARKPADMRRSFDGLCAMVREEMAQCPSNGHLFVFRNKRCDRLKVIYFDRDGLAIWYKRLEQGQFHWPRGQEDVIELNPAEVACILSGIEVDRAKRYKRFALNRQAPK